MTQLPAFTNFSELDSSRNIKCSETWTFFDNQENVRLHAQTFWGFMLNMKLSHLLTIFHIAPVASQGIAIATHLHTVNLMII